MEIDGIIRLDESNYKPYEALLQAFYQQFPEAPEYSTFLDQKDLTCFSLASVKAFGAGDNAAFKMPREHFINSHFGPPLFQKIAENNPILSSMELAANTEMVFSFRKDDKLDMFNRLDGKKILIIMGGPSTNDIEWNANEYDEVFLLNEGYKNDKARKEKISLLTIAADQDHWDPKLHEFLTDNPECSILFCADRLDPPSAIPDMNKIFEMYPDRTLAMNTRYSSCLGIGPKIILFSILLGAREIAFCGLDGRDKKEVDGNLIHAFNTKKEVPGWFKAENGLRVQLRQFVLFYEYTQYLRQTLGLDFALVNLSKGHPMNKLLLL